MAVLPECVLRALEERPFQLLALCRTLPQGGFAWMMYPGVNSIQAILGHMLEAEEYWIYKVLQGEPVPVRDTLALDTPDKLEAAWRPVRQRTVAWLREQPTSLLDERRPLPWNAADQRTVEEILWHFVTHEFHHKGQVCTRLAYLGVKVPDLDLLQ